MSRLAQSKGGFLGKCNSEFHFEGREQAELTGLRLASLGLKFNKIVHSSMTRAIETTDIISKHLPGECLEPVAGQLVRWPWRGLL